MTRLLVLLFSQFLLIHNPGSRLYAQLSENKPEYRELIVMKASKKITIPGESIYLYLQCYLPENKPSWLSKIAYIELVDATGTSVLNTSVSLNHGEGKGKIYLPSYLKSGNYTLIAYTSWMQNYSPSNIPQLPLAILSPFEALPVPDDEDNLQLSFEGDSFVPGVFNKLVYHLPNRFRDQKNLKGAVIDGNGKKVAGFSNSWFGIGHCSFIPQDSQHYQMVIEDQKGEFFFYPVTSTYDSFGISIKEKDDHFLLSVRSDPAKADIPLILKVKTSYGIHRTIKVSSPQNSVGLKLSKSGLPAGLFEVRLENTLGEIFSRRIAFNPFILHPVNVQPGNKIYPSRSHVTIQLLGDSLTGRTVALTVRKKKAEESGIFLNHYIVLSQLRTQWIDFPFSTGILGGEVSPHFDDWLISQSLQEYNDAPTGFDHLPDYRGKMLAGNLLDQNETPVPQQPVSVTIPGPNFKLATAVTDNNGIFRLNLQQLHGEKTAVFGVGRGNKVVLKTPSLRNYDFIKPVEQRYPFNPEWLNQKSIEVQIENAYYQYKIDKPIIPEHFNEIINNISQTYFIEDYTLFPTMREVIVEYVQGVSLQKKAGADYFYIRDVINASGNIDTVMVLLNGIPCSMKTVLDLNPLNIEKIDLVQKQFKVGAFETRGMVLISTNADNAKISGLEETHQSISITGPQPDFEYYQPVYGQQEDSLSRIPDYRDQLLWIPAHTFKSDTAKFEFYCSDLTGVYEIVVEGISDNKEILYGYSTFEVK